MKKQLVCFTVLLIILVQSSSCAFAKSSSSVAIAMKKYKSGNYTGCLQDCISIVNRDPSNALAYYYMALSYTQAGRKDDAVRAYSKVLTLKANSKIADYAETGRRCLVTPDKCKPDDASAIAPSSNPDIDALINSPSLESPVVRKDFQQKHLDSIRTEINNGKDLDNYTFDKLNQAEPQEVIATKPTNEDVVKAIKVLNDAGISPYSQTPQLLGSSDANNSQNSELAQLNMLMGSEGQNKNANSMMDMLPMMFAQNKDGASNYSPQAMQAVIMNSMMTNLNYDVDNNK